MTPKTKDAARRRLRLSRKSLRTLSARTLGDVRGLATGGPCATGTERCISYHLPPTVSSERCGTC